MSGNFTVANTGAQQLVGASGASGWTLVIGGDFNLSGGNFNFSSGTSGTLALNLAGSYNQSGGSFDCSNSGSTLDLNFTGSGSSFRQSGGALLTSRMNFNVANNASLTLNNGLIVGASRAFTVNGTLNCGANVISGAGAFTLAGGGTLAIGDTGGISASGASGDIQVGGPRTFSAAANYIYNGTAAQLSGDGLPASVNNLTISNRAGVALSVTTTVNNLLGLTSGVLHTGANQLNLAAGATVSGASSNSYVDGTLQKAFGAGIGQSFTFPVGDSSTYAPVNIASLNVGSAGALAASTIAGDHSGLAAGGLDSSRSVNRYWTLAAGGGLATSTCNATFNYAAGDVDTGASTGSFPGAALWRGRLGHYDDRDAHGHQRPGYGPERLWGFRGGAESDRPLHGSRGHAADGGRGVHHNRDSAGYPEPDRGVGQHNAGHPERHGRRAV